jgi:hypothetical protein
MVLPIAALLPVAGAAIGGITGYQRSGGNLGSALLGAGLGATVPGGFRMAGQALGSGLLGKTALGQLAATKAAKGIALSQADKALLAAPAAAGLAAGGLGLMATPALAGTPAAELASPARTAASGAAGLMYPGGGAGPAQYGGDALPPGMGQFGPTDPYGTTLEILNPAGVAAGRRAEYGKTIEQQRDAMRTLLPEIFQASEARSKAELQRQLAAAGVRQNIITAANMLERSQQAAQQMGLNAASQAGSALTSQYQYQ